MATGNYTIKPLIKKDPFTGEMSLSMHLFAPQVYKYSQINSFCVSSMNGSSAVVLNISPVASKDKYGMTAGGVYLYSTFFGDELRISVLFDDNSIIKKRPILVSSGLYLWKLIDSDCESFLFKKIKVLRCEDGSSTIDFYFSGDECFFKGVDELFPDLIEVFLDSAAKELGWTPAYEEIVPESIQRDTDDTNFEDQADFCYVYLMNDTANGYYKIGMSRDPVFRESTLQSEKPTIVKVCEKKFPSRKIAHSIETALHRVYDSKRVRGEWFSLKEKDIWEIKQILS